MRDLRAQGLCGKGDLIAVGTSFRGVVREYLRQPGCRTFAVVDWDNCVKGVIPVQLLDETVFFDVFLVSAPREVDGMESALEVMHEMRHKTAGELMGKAEVVRMDDTVHDVFVRMHRVGVSSRPIVDRNDRAAGDLDLCVRAAL